MTVATSTTPAEAYEGLKTELEICEIGGLFLAFYSDEQVPGLVIERLIRDMPDHFNLMLKIDERKASFSTFFGTSFEPMGHQPNIFHVTGLHELTPERLEDMFRYLQSGRERFQAKPYSLVFWVKPDMEQRIFNLAPDFYHWIFGKYDFTEMEVSSSYLDDRLALLSLHQYDVMEAIWRYLQRVVYQYQNWEEVMQKGESFLVEPMERANLHDYYVKSYCLDKDGQTRALDDYFAEFVVDPEKSFLTLLGDFGTGKTSFALHYFAKMALLFLQDPRMRIPVFISLKDYKGRLNIEDLIRSEFYAKYGLEMTFYTFQELALQGRFLFFIDGFDEMRSLSDQDVTLANLKELTKLTFENVQFIIAHQDAKPQLNKVFLTCRTHYFLTETQAQKLLRADYTILYRDYATRSSYELTRLKLKEFTTEQIATYVRKNLKDEKRSQELLTLIDTTYNLAELAQRPILLDMIIKALPDLRNQTQINAADLYRSYTSQWIGRDDWRSGMTPTGKRAFMWELATRMYQQGESGGYALHYKALPPPDSTCLKPEFEQQDDDYYFYETTTCSFLNRDGEGNYKFIHKSFMEYFIAEKLASSDRASLENKLITNIEIRFFFQYLLDCPPVFTGNLPESLEERDEHYFSTIDGSELMYVPSGPFVYGEDETKQIIHLKTGFFIQKHPVTNAQYRKFLKADGYRTRELWSEEGWRYIQKEKRTKPPYWQDKKWNQPEQPVVGVTWYEAEAYANWIKGRLPHEQEWEKAARGIDGRVYPWGDEQPTEKLLNFNENVGKTTPVDTYSDGQSPYGLLDCAGNVWEWCKNRYQGGRVVRGGSVDLTGYLARSAIRDDRDPSRLHDYQGFRCCVFPIHSTDHRATDH